MSNTARAAEIIRGEYIIGSEQAEVAANALSAARLLVTDEIQAVLDAIVALEPPRSKPQQDLEGELWDAARAYIASRAEP